MDGKGYLKLHKQRTLALVLIMILGCGVLGSLFFYHKSKNAMPKRIICIPKIIDQENDFWVQLLEGVKMAGLEYGLEVEIVAASQENAFEEQNKLIYWAIEQNPSAIILVPSSRSATAEAAATFSESTPWNIGILATVSHLALTSAVSPVPSVPSTMASFSSRTSAGSSMETDLSDSAIAAVLKPSAFSRSSPGWGHWL